MKLRLEEDDEVSVEEEVKPEKRASESDARGGTKRLKTESGLRCKICRQWKERALLYEGHPNGALDQYTGICTDSIRVDLGDDQLPQFRITDFAFYDREGHLVSLDSGVIERNQEIFLSGYLKLLTDDSPTIKDGVPVFDVGPILQWWNGGFDGGAQEAVGVSTDVAEYYLRAPSTLYKPVWREVLEKSKLTKIVIEFLEDARINSLEVTFEDLVLKVTETELEEGVNLTQEGLLKHSAFIVEQVSSYEDVQDSSDEDEDDFIPDDGPSASSSKSSLQPLLFSKCMRDLISFSGVQELKRRSKDRKSIVRKPTTTRKPSKVMQGSQATTTPLVRAIFETLFDGQISKGKEQEKSDKSGKTRDKRCGVCSFCQKPDCGTCGACKDMVKFDGSGKSKQACEGRKCPNMGYYDDVVALDDSFEDEAPLNKTPITHKVKSGFKSKKQSSKVSWLDSKPARVIDGIKYYNRVSINGEEFVPGDFVMIRPDDPSTPLYISYLVSLFACEESGAPTGHVVWLSRGSDTILSETGDPRELFLLSECEEVKLTEVAHKALVVHFPPPSNWKEIGGTDKSLVTPPLEQDDKSFFYRFIYEESHCRFEYFNEDLSELRLPNEQCKMCIISEEKNGLNAAPKIIENNSVKIANVIYKPNDAIFLSPSAFECRYNLEKINEQKQKELHEELEKDKNYNHQKYPEKYRKTKYVKGSNVKTPNPFNIALILEIIPVKASKIKIKVRKMYRPENTHLLIDFPEKVWSKDMNLIYWSDDEVTVDAEDIRGKCHVRPKCSISDPIERWSRDGEYRFYYDECYNVRSRAFSDLSFEAEKYGRQFVPSKNKGKGKSSAPKSGEKEKICDMNALPEVKKRLKALDVFAGCGGLSKGLYDAGVSESTWAIEIFQPAARAFKANHPDCTVFTDDCNKLLQEVIEGKTHNQKKQRLPQKGEVELLAGGPPCQGFSGMNRFNHREYSLFKNSLVTSYLAYCDYYRPKYFILENVRNFASFKNSMVLKMCMSALVKMGYQCTFAVLQAGMCGVAQTRRRAILLAAAPGEKLPLYPEPRHVFAKSALTVQVNDKVYASNARWTDSAPYRTVTVRDTMSDLPAIKNGDQTEIRDYDKEPESPFQREMRKGATHLVDHMTKTMAPLIEARMSLIPIYPGSDWRDLPNIKMELSDGSFTDVLLYPHNDHLQGKSPYGTLRGVCLCATKPKAKCDPMDKQGNTLIPWCLPHTGNRHNHWSGLYGRIEWDGFFSTTVTNPEPMGKQGRVLHPDQNRLVSVRECARSQGFPDNFKFSGSILDKHRQIGNAVPPPMGFALGIEIRKVMNNCDDSTKLSGAFSSLPEDKNGVEMEVVASTN